MPDLLPSRSALAEIYREGALGVAGDAAGVVLSERPPLAILQLASWPGSVAAVRARVRDALALDLPDIPNMVASTPEVAALWLGPERWLIVAPGNARTQLVKALGKVVTPDIAALAELSDARTVIRLAGPRARELLAKGCELDLHPRSFVVGRCAQTILAHVATLIHLIDPSPSFDLYLPRSYAVTFWEWLVDSASELGVRVERPVG